MKTVLFLLLLNPVLGWAQVYKITPQDAQRKQSFLLMRDGSVVRGQILRQDSTLISVRKRGGDLSYIEADQVISVLADRSELPENRANVQTASPYKVYVMKDGARVEGQFVRRDSAMITVRKPNGQFTYFEPELLARIDTVQGESVSGGGRVFANRFSPYLLTGLTAYNPEKGRFYYRNTWLLLNELQYGITRFWSVGAKFVTPIPYLVLADGYYGTGQYTGDLSQFITKLSAAVSPQFRLSVNASFQPYRQYAYRGMGGRWTLQALATVGNSQRNVTVGYGIVVPKAQQLLYYTYQPITSSAAPQYVYVTIPNRSFLSLGIMQKVGPNLTFLSDNSINIGQQTYYTNSGSGRASVSAALRIDRRRHAFDLGIYSFIYQRPFLWDNGRSTRFFPYVGYNLLIGRD